MTMNHRVLQQIAQHAFESSVIGAHADVGIALDRPFTRTAPTSGSGVGLYVCRNLVRQMHGQISLLTDQPQGFGVSLQLPGAA